MTAASAAATNLALDAADGALPHNEELERQTLQFMCEHGETVPEFMAAGLMTEHYRRRDYRLVAGLVLDIYRAGYVVTWYLVRAEILKQHLRFDNPLSFEDFTIGVPRPIRSNIPRMVTELRELFEHRELLCRLLSGESPRRVTREYLERLRAGDVDLQEAIGEPFPDFHRRLEARPTPTDIVPGLVPGNAIGMIHGQPRALKSWIVQEIARALTTGDTAFGLERFRVPAPLATWYLTEEDPELAVRDRFVCLFAGRDQAWPDRLHLTVQKSVNLDDPSWQRRMVAYAKRAAIRLTVIDPIRAMSGAVDQGPREIKPLAAFLRYYIRETGSQVWLNHHDVKPLNGKSDDRARPQRASGGGIFSIADAPCHVELVGPSGTQTLIVPTAYKFSVSPDPFVVSLEADDPKWPTWARMQGSTATAAKTTEFVLHQKIRDYLLEHPGTSGSKVVDGIHADKARVLNALEDLLKSGQADYYKKGQGKYWTIYQQSGRGGSLGPDVTTGRPVEHR